MNNPLDLKESEIEKLVLDTHILIWYLEGIKLSDKEITLIENVRNNNKLYISAISVWEIALLVNKEKIVLSISLDEWLNKVKCICGLNIIDLSLDILINSCNLTNYTHKDPADRMIIATCRNINSHLITYDERILDYGKRGYIKIC